MSKMTFGPVRGYVRNGPDYGQDFAGWKIYANKPKRFEVTEVVVVMATEYDKDDTADDRQASVSTERVDMLA